jgi:steroid delta-isomerase-like uncharacterized protein
MAEALTDAERTARAYVDLWNEQDYAAIPEVVSESFVHVDPGGEEFRGRDGLESFMRAVFDGFPDFGVRVDRMVSGDGLVMYEGTLSMTHEGEFEGIPPTGRAVELREMATIEVEDGRVEAHRVYYDNAEVADQLGLADE